MCNQLLRNQILETRKHVCVYCSKKLERTEITIDHLLPISRGGQDLEDNLVIACSDCNSEKSCMTKEEYQQYKKITTNFNMTEKIYTREIFLYCIFNKIKIDSISMEKFLMLNRRDTYLTNTIFKLMNETNEYKKFYTKTTQDYIFLKEELRRIESELETYKNLNKKLEEAKDLKTIEKNSEAFQNIKIEDIVVVKSIKVQIDQVRQSRNSKSKKSDRALIYLKNNNYFLLANLDVYKVCRDNFRKEVPCKIISRDEELDDKQFNLINTCHIFQKYLGGI